MVSYNHRHPAVYACVVQLLFVSQVYSFLPPSPPSRSFAWHELSSTSEDITSLRVSEIKQELKDRGISFQDCFDKESLIQRLQEAREGKVQAAPKQPQSQQPESTTASIKVDAETAAASIDHDKLLEELRSMSVKELRQELASRQIRRAGLLEKEDLVQALFNARKEAAHFSATGLITPGQVADLTGVQVQQELQKSSSPLLLDVYAVWCGPCQMMVPILQEVAIELGNRVRVAKMDSDKYPQEASQFHVQGLPTLVLFNNGQEVDRIEGALMKDDLVEWVNSKL